MQPPAINSGDMTTLPMEQSRSQEPLEPRSGLFVLGSDGALGSYLDTDSWWASRTGCSVYGMIRDTGRLMDDLRLKQLAAKHEETLATHSFGKHIKTSDVFNSLFRWSACELGPGSTNWLLCYSDENV